MKHEPIFNWDPETGLASCILSDGSHVFTGFAQCHQDDMDMSSEKTGCEIALRRAKINALKEYKKELKISLKALNQLYYSMNKSSHFNEKSYENRMLRRQINRINFDLATVKEMIATEKQELRDYLQKKDEFYTKIRRIRKKDNSN